MAQSKFSKKKKEAVAAALGRIQNRAVDNPTQQPYKKGAGYLPSSLGYDYRKTAIPGKLSSEHTDEKERSVQDEALDMLRNHAKGGNEFSNKIDFNKVGATIKNGANGRIAPISESDIVKSRVDIDNRPKASDVLRKSWTEGRQNGNLARELSATLRSSGNASGKNPDTLYDTSGLSASRRKAYAEAAIADKDNPLVLAENTKINPDTSKYDADKLKRYTAMTDEEKARYNEIYGLYGKQQAEEYRDLIADDINSRIASDRLKNDNDLKNPIAKTAYMFGSGVASGLNGIKEAGEWTAGLERTKATPINKYVASGIRSDKDNNAVENVLYDIAQSTGYMAPGMLLSGGLGALGVGSKVAQAAGNTLFGLAQAGNTYRDDLNEGRDSSRAWLHGAQQGIDETATNWLLGGINAFGGGALKRFIGDRAVGKALVNGVDRIAKTATGKVILKRVGDALTDMGGEATQEYLQFYTENLTNNLLYGEDNSLNPADPDAWYAAALGALNAGLLNLPNNIAKTTQGLTADISLAKDMAESLDVDASHYDSVEDFEKIQILKAVAEEVAPKVENGTVTAKDKIAFNEALADVLTSDANTAYNESLDSEELNSTDIAIEMLKANSSNALSANASANANNFANTSDNGFINEGFINDDFVNEGFEISENYYDNDISSHLTSIEDRAKRFKGNAKNIYINAYNGQNIVDYDEAMTAAYNAGRSGNSLGTLIDNEAFNSFYRRNPDAAEDMWSEGYNNRATNNTRQQIKSDSNNDISDINNYTISTYNKYGWAYANKVLNKQNSAEFFNGIRDIRNGYPVNQSADGLYMIETSSGKDGAKDTIIYTDGDYENPSIERVVKINATNETEASSIKREIYAAEKYSTNRPTPLERTISGRAIDERSFKIYGAQDFLSFRELRNGRREGTVRQESNSGSKRIKNRGRNASEARAVSQDEHKFLDWVGDKTGLKIEVSSDIRGTAEIDLKHGIMRINPNSENLAGSVSHELIHLIKSETPDKYNILRGLTIEVLKESNNVSYDELFAEYADRYREVDSNYSDEDIIEEIVADGATAFLNDADFAERVAKKDKTLAKRIADFFRDIADTLKKIINEKGIRRVGKALRENAEIYSQAASVWFDAVETASNSYKSKVISGQISPSLATSLNKNGIDIEGDAAVKYSLKSFNETDKQALLDDLVYAGYDKTQSKKWIDDVSSVAAIISKNKNLDYTEGSGTWLKNNAETIKSLDGSFLCPKKSLFQGTYNAILEKLPNIALNADEYIELKNMLTSRGYEVPCVYCYNESRTQNIGQYAKEFLEQYEGDVNLTSKDLTTTEGLGRLQTEHADVYDEWLKFRQSAHGLQRSVKFDAYNVAYHREDIMNMSAEDRRAINNDGGLRWFAFSDFKTEQMIDCMQAVLDLAAMNMKSYAYTKQEAFVRVFGDTNIITNLSVAGELKNGKLVFDSSNGMDINTARKLRKKYSKTAGITLVGVNDAHILAAMASPEIDMIIPFHRSGLSNADMKKLGIADYTDYQQSGDQNEHWLSDGKKVANNLLISDYWNTNKSGKVNAQRYLKECARTGREPKFSRFLEKNTDSSGRTIYSLKADGSTDGYWKLLVDHKMYDNDGIGIDQEEVIPDFDMTAAKKILRSYDGNANEFPVAQDVVDEFVHEHISDSKTGNSNVSKKFQLKEPIEETKDLIAVRNVDQNNLASMLELEGLPSPSIAITKADIGHTQFGDVTFIFDKDTIDPQYDKRNQVWDADAWTPLYPGIEYEYDKRNIQNVYNVIQSASGVIPEEYANNARATINHIEFGNKSLKEIKEKLYDDVNMKAVYLASNGNTVEMQTNTKEHSMSVPEAERSEFIVNKLGKDEVIKGRFRYPNLMDDVKDAYKSFLKERYAFSKQEIDNVINNTDAKKMHDIYVVAKSFAKNGREWTEIIEDKESTDAAIEKATDRNEYRAWIDNLTENIIADKGIRNNKDIFTSNGDRRSFRQLHDPVTAENIVKAMWRDKEQGAVFLSGHTAKSIRGASARKYNSIDEMHRDSGRLKKISDGDEFSLNQDKLLENADSKLADIRSNIYDRNNIGLSKGTEPDRIIVYDNAYNEAVLNAATKAKTAGAVKRYFAKEDVSITDSEAKGLLDAFNELRELPTDYFEAKPKRVVDWNEIKLAVVPDNIDSALIDQLKEKGVQRIETYPEGDDATRLEMENKAADLRFQLDENEEVKKQSERLGKMLSFVDYAPTDKAIERTAKRLKKYTETSYSVEEISDRLKSLYDEIANNDNINGEEITQKAADIAGELISSPAKLFKDQASKEEYTRYRNAIKSYTFHMPEGFDGEIKTLGGIGNLRKEFPFTLNITKNKGISIDTMYQELSELYPDMFNSDITNPADQLEDIVDKLRALKPQESTSWNTDEDYEAFKHYAAQEIFNAYVSEGIASAGNKAAFNKLQKQYADSRSNSVDDNNSSYAYNSQPDDDFDANDYQKLAEQRKRYKPLTEGLSDAEVDKRLKKLAAKYGVIEKGYKPLVDVSVPKKTSDNKNVRRFVRTVLESGIPTDEMSTAIKNSILDEALSYEPITDMAARKHSEWVVDKNGLAYAQKEWDSVVMSRHEATKEKIAVGELLLKRYAEAGDTEGVLRMTAEIAVEATRAGQVVQAMSMLKKLKDNSGTEGAAIGLTLVQKEVDKLNRDYEVRFKSAKKIPHIDINEKLAEEYLKADTEEGREAAYARLIQDIADQTPNTIADKLNQWRYLAMLGNPRTHIRNIVGNAIFMPAIAIKNTIATGIENTYSGEKTKAIFVEKEYKDFAEKDFSNMKEILSGGRKGDIKSDIMAAKNAFGNSKLAAPLNKVAEFNSNALEYEDMLFLKHHYIRALSMYLQSNNVDVESLKQNKTALIKARQYAVNEAQKATYRDASATAAWLNTAARSGNKGLSLFVESVLPFKKTPINILKRGVEYSPIGLINAVSRQTKKLNRGDITFNEWADSLASGLTGTGILMLGAFLTSIGLLNGAYSDDDKEKEMQKLQGYQEYAVNIFGKSYTVDWAAPICMPLFIGAEVYSAFQRDGEVQLKDILEGMNSITAPMLNLSMLSGLQDTIEAVSYDDQKLPALATQVVIGYLSQFVPTIMGQVARTVDTTQRINYVDKNSPLPSDAVYFIEKMQNKIPFLSYLNAPKLDQWGNENVTANRFIAAFENFISPGYINDINDKDAVNNEIIRLNKEKTSDTNVNPKTAAKYFKNNGVRTDLTSEQYYDYQLMMGKTAYTLLDNMISSKTYDSFTADEQAELFKNVYTYSNAIARMEIQPDYVPTSDEWVLKAKEAYEKDNMEVTDYIMNKSKLSQFKGENKQKDVIKYIRKQTNSKVQRKVLWDIAGYSDKTFNDHF